MSIESKKKELLEVLWELVAADDLIDPYEENIIDSKFAEYSQILQSCSSKYEYQLPCAMASFFVISLASIAASNRYAAARCF